MNDKRVSLASNYIIGTSEFDEEPCTIRPITKQGQCFNIPEEYKDNSKFLFVKK